MEVDAKGALVDYRPDCYAGGHQCSTASSNAAVAMMMALRWDTPNAHDLYALAQIFCLVLQSTPMVPRAAGLFSATINHLFDAAHHLSGSTGMGGPHCRASADEALGEVRAMLEVAECTCQDDPVINSALLRTTLAYTAGRFDRHSDQISGSSVLTSDGPDLTVRQHLMNASAALLGLACMLPPHAPRL